MTVIPIIIAAQSTMIGGLSTQTVNALVPVSQMSAVLANHIEPTQIALVMKNKIAVQVMIGQITLTVLATEQLIAVLMLHILIPGRLAIFVNAIAK